jgi:hypothetical protein
MEAKTGLGFHEKIRILSKKCTLCQGAFFAKNKIQVSLFLNQSMFHAKPFGRKVEPNLVSELLAAHQTATPW